MRNLKKILALVLAFLMSLSLMVTAGAKDFPDSDGITNDAYALAVDILSDLDVFNGDQNGNFNPTQDITRAEVAAIIYRIATGDVGVDGYKTYAPYNQFKDIDVEDWYAGYVTYCANAGYIKGRNTGNFDAKDPVTGYEVLAMILRAVGYDKNNEFVGSNWQLNTASIATEKGVLANILKDGTVRLSEPASRQVVAEMLFRAIFIDMVDWNAATLSYTPNGRNLAKENLGTESVTGVIMANEWANINEGGTLVLAEGKTQLKPVDEKALTLDIATDLDAVGCSYTAYIQNETRVLGELEYCEDLNTVAFNDGAETTVAKLRGSLKLGDETAYFLNYSEDLGVGHYSSHVIRYAIAETSCTAANGWKEYITSLVKKSDGTDVVAGHSYETRKITINNVSTDCYVVTIQPNNWITDEDYEIMQRIFYSADRLNTTIAPENVQDLVVVGEVYVGTNSTVDVSDWNPNTNSALSWDEFVETYLNPVDVQYIYTGCKNGESLRVIDNDGDGVVDYIFKVEYWQDKAVDTEKDELVYYVLDLNDYAYSTFEDEILVGDVVNYTDIDGRVTVYKADMITGKVTEKSFENETILTTADDTVYGQSEIYNNTLMLDQIMNTEDETEYNFYLDEYGYIRTYELAQGTQYALLTEIYNTTGQAYNYVNTNIYTAEVVIGDEEAHEYRIANANPFISAFAWTSRISNYYYTDGDLNFLQPAIAHLGINGRNAVADETLYTGATLGKTYGYINEDWNRGVFVMGTATQANTKYPDTVKPLTGTSLAPDYGVFNYGTVTGETYTGDAAETGIGNGTLVNESFSFTNVAIYGLGDNDTITLRTASKLKIDQNGNQKYYWQDPTLDLTTDPVTPATYPWGNKTSDPATGIGRKQMTQADWLTAYAASTGNTLTTAEKQAIIKDCLVEVYDVDYVQLRISDSTTDKVTAGKAHYYIASNYSSNYNALENGYVNATVETEFYIAMPNKVLHYVGYDKLPTIDTAHIRAAYAVATNTYQDSTDHDYWIANVIVIEVESLDDPYDSISLMYYNPNEISGSVRNVRSLNNQWRAYQPDSEDEANIPVVPKTSDGGSATWGNQSWSGSNYGFYEIYDSVYEDGTLDAGDVKLLPALTTTDWAGHGIYAGTIQRIYGLTSSEYIDVDFLGRDYVEGGIHDADVKAVSVTTGDTAVPIYRVNAQNTTDLRLGKRVSTSDVQLGDQLILVYNKARTALAYIVDLGTRLDANDRVIYQAPDWLWTNYEAIVGNKNAADTLKFTANFKQYLGTNSDGEAVVKTFPVPKDISITSSETSTKTVAVSSFVGVSVPTGYKLVDVVSHDTDSYTVTVTPGSGVVTSFTIHAENGYNLRTGVSLELVYDYDESVGGSALPILAEAKEGQTELDKTGWEIIGMVQSTKASSMVRAGEADTEDPQPGDMVELYFDVAANYDVESVTINSPAAYGDKEIAGEYKATHIVGTGPIETAVTAGCVRWYIVFVLPDVVVDLTINVADDNVKITTPAHTTLGTGGGAVTGIAKGVSLNGVKLELVPDAGYSVPDSVSITVNGKALVEDILGGDTKDFGYDNTTGVITFHTGVADGPIVITGSTAVANITLTLTSDDTSVDLSTAVVKQGDETVEGNRSSSAYSWTLKKGIAYTISVTVPAQAGSRLDVSMSGDENPTVTHEGNVWTGTVALGDAGVNNTVNITADYTEVVELTITVTGADGAAVSVTGGNAEQNATTKVWTVDKGEDVTITVSPKSGETFLGAPTATGLVFAEDTGSYKVADVAIDEAKTIAITCTGYYPKSVTMGTAPSGVTYKDNGVVDLTIQANGTATGTLTLTVAKDALTENQTTSKLEGEFSISAPSAGNSGGTYALSGSGYSNGKLTVSEATVGDDGVEVNLTVTFTPNS